MPAPYPYFNGTGIISLIRYVNEDLTSGLFIIGILIVFPTIVFISSRQIGHSSAKSFAVMAWLELILIITFWWAGLINNNIERIFAIAIIILMLSVAWMKGSETQFS